MLALTLGALSTPATDADRGAVAGAQKHGGSEAPGQGRGKGKSERKSAPPATPPAVPGCAHADDQPAEIGLEAARQALLCAMNAERADRGLPTLRFDDRLGAVAERHSSDMVKRRYFSHDTKRGRSWSERVRSSGYTRGARYWRIGETLAWAGGAYTTASARVQAWLDSKPHRKVMLREDFREVGLGIVLGTPEGVPGATFTADYGRVR